MRTKYFVILQLGWTQTKNEDQCESDIDEEVVILETENQQEAQQTFQLTKDFIENP